MKHKRRVDRLIRETLQKRETSRRGEEEQRARSQRLREEKEAASAMIAAKWADVQRRVKEEDEEIEREEKKAAAKREKREERAKQGKRGVAIPAVLPPRIIWIDDDKGERQSASWATNEEGVRWGGAFWCGRGDDGRAARGLDSD